MTKQYKKTLLAHFWKNQAQQVSWYKFPSKAINYDKKNNKHIWFEDGLINACYNCLDLNIEKGLGKKTAIHAIDKTGKINSISYEELLKAVINFSFFLKSKIKNK